MSTSPLVVSYGGGVNSLAMLIGYCAIGVRPDAIVFSDTRGEKPGTYTHLENVVRPWLRERGLSLTIACRADSERTKVGDDSLEAECLRLGTLPSRAYGFGTCADKWKIDPFKWWIAEWEPAKRCELGPIAERLRAARNNGHDRTEELLHAELMAAIAEYHSEYRRLLYELRTQPQGLAR